jgi:hypothetical protein
MRLVFIVAGVCLSACALPAQAIDHLSLLQEGIPLELRGQVLAQSPAGEIALLAEDHVLWIAAADEVTSRTRDGAAFEPLNHDAMAARLLSEMPRGFRIHKTAHYVVCYNTTSAYAEWCGALYERLYRGFFSFWQNQGFELEEPAWPLVALVFDDRASYARYSRTELGEATRSIIGYYSLHTNRVTMYDLTGVDRGGEVTTPTSAAHINQILTQPAAERTVATIVHEATHQLVYNSGLLQRYAAVPLWLSEGLAVYFETPDLNSARGWREIGAINRVSLANFHASVDARAHNSLELLLRDDARLRDPREAAAAYGEAWALTYYLLRSRRDQFMAYLQALSRLPPLRPMSPEQRLAEFKLHFGRDLAALDAELVRYMQRLR